VAVSEPDDDTFPAVEAGAEVDDLVDDLVVGADDDGDEPEDE
jgi:hypothetical protein